MRPKIIELVGAGSTNPIPLNWATNGGRPFEVALLVQFVGGAVGTVTCQFTLDDIQDPAFVSATADWRDITGLTAIAANGRSNLEDPVRAIRMTNNPGFAGTTRLKIIQTGG